MYRHSEKLLELNPLLEIIDHYDPEISFVKSRKTPNKSDAVVIRSVDFSMSPSCLISDLIQSVIAQMTTVLFVFLGSPRVK